MKEVFRGLHLKNFSDISKWNTSNVTNMDGMFRNLTINGKSPNISNWNTSNVISMAYIFDGMWCGYEERKYDKDGN